MKYFKHQKSIDNGITPVYPSLMVPNLNMNIFHICFRSKKKLQIQLKSYKYFLWSSSSPSLPSLVPILNLAFTEPLILPSLFPVGAFSLLTKTNRYKN